MVGGSQPERRAPDSENDIARWTRLERRKVGRRHSFRHSTRPAIRRIPAREGEENRVVRGPVDHLSQKLGRRGVDPVNILDEDYQTSFVGYGVDEIE